MECVKLIHSLRADQPVLFIPWIFKPYTSRHDMPFIWNVWNFLKLLCTKDMFNQKLLKCVFSRYTCDVKVLQYFSLYNKFARSEYCSLMHVCSHMFIVLCMFILPHGGDT